MYIMVNTKGLTLCILWFKIILKEKFAKGNFF